MYYTIYRVTNNVNGRFYIGMHKTKNLDDSYLGSGKLLKRAILKYGIQTFTKEILFVFDTPEEMYAKEIELITEDLIKDSQCYNLTIGGWGGNRLTKDSSSWSESHLNRMTELARIRAIEDPIRREAIRQQALINFREHTYSPTKSYSSFKGKQHSEASKAMMSERQKFRLNSHGNPQTSKRWVTNDIEERSVPSVELVPNGWRLGRLKRVASFNQ